MANVTCPAVIANWTPSALFRAENWLTVFVLARVRIDNKERMELLAL